MKDQIDNNDPPNSQSLTGCFLRIFWIMIGNALVVFCATEIFRNPTGFVSAADAFYWAFVASLAGARYADVRYYHGVSAEGNPATLAEWRRYALRLVAVAGAGWLVIHAARYLWLSV